MSLLLLFNSSAPTTPQGSGVGDVMLGQLTAAGTGTFVPYFIGTGDVTLSPLTVEAAGTFRQVFDGTGQVTLAAAQVSGTGEFSPPVYTGVGVVIVGNLQCESAGHSAEFASGIFADAFFLDPIADMFG